MKKIMLFLIAGFMLLANQAMAGGFGPTSAGGKVTITGDSSMGNLEYNPSPGVIMSGITSDDAYTIGAYNTKTTVDNGNDYAATSNSTGYAMRARTDTALNLSSETAGSLSGSWTWMGGSGS